VNLEKKQSHCGIAAVETAIILMSAILVAAVLLAVVFNAVFSTIQKTKSFITAGVTESFSRIFLNVYYLSYSGIARSNKTISGCSLSNNCISSNPL